MNPRVCLTYCVVVVLIVFMVQTSVVESRVLRPDCDQNLEMVSFSGVFNDTGVNVGSLMRSLGFVLASGPSKRGAGH